MNGPLLSIVPKETISDVNEQVSNVVKEGKMRGEYATHSYKKRLAITNYAAEHGVAKAIPRFKNK